MDELLQIIIILIVPFFGIPFLIVLFRYAFKLRAKQRSYEIDLTEVQLGKSNKNIRPKIRYNEYSYNIRRIKVFTPIGMQLQIQN